MPIHLPPMKRRDFLATSLSALVSTPVWAASENSSAEHWALWSDTHISQKADRVSRGIKMSEHLAQAVKLLLGQKQAVSRVMINGDCAFDIGEPGDYHAFVKLLAPLREAGLPIDLTLGNHDNRDVFWKIVGKPKKQPLEDRQVTIIESNNVRWILLDTLIKPKVVAGAFGEEQFAWLKKYLTQHRDKPTVLYAHHNPTEYPFKVETNEKSKKHSLLDTDKLFDLILPMTHVKAYIHGHNHKWYRKQIKGMHIVGLPAIAYVFDKAQPSGFVTAHTKPSAMELTLHSLDPKHPENGKTYPLTWR